jgi:hypothetical protein
VSGVGIQLEKYNAARFNQLIPAHRSYAFACLGFETYLVRAQSEYSGDAVSDRIVVIGQLRALGMDDAIKIHNLITGIRDFRGGDGKHLGRVALRVGLVRIWKHASDVAQGGSPQQRVGHGVQQNVGVAMADKLPVVRHVDAA